MRSKPPNPSPGCASFFIHRLHSILFWVSRYVNVYRRIADNGVSFVYCIIVILNLFLSELNSPCSYYYDDIIFVSYCINQLKYNSYCNPFLLDISYCPTQMRSASKNFFFYS